MSVTTSRTSTKRKPKLQVGSNTSSDKPRLPLTLEALQFLRTAKGKSDSLIHAQLDRAYSEVKKEGFELLLERILLHIGDVSRQHNVLKELGIKSQTGGAQERAVFRSILRWWEKKMPDSFIKNLKFIAEFTLYENLMFYQITTDRRKGTVLSEEILFPMPSIVQNFLASQIRAGADLRLIARHLPKYETGKSRVSKILVKAKKDKQEFSLTIDNREWIKVNGEKVNGPKIKVKAGDVVTYPRQKKSNTLKKQVFVNAWIRDFCEVMGWTIAQYKDFRKKQDSAEQKFSNKEVLGMSKADFNEFLDKLTAGQRFRVAKMLAFKDESGKLGAKAKWQKLGEWYIEWEKNQEKVADSLRELAARGVEDPSKKKELMTQLKVKSTGVQTVDLIVQLLSGKYSDTQVNNTYQSLIEKMDLIANVFPVIDGSGSMDANDVNVNGANLSRRLVAYTLAIAFSTRNPVEEFRNTFGWFSSNFHICGNSKYVDDRPNRYVSRAAYRRQVPEYAVLSPGKTFTDNLAAIKAADPQEVSSTNISSSLEYFMNLVDKGKCHLEDLPSALLFITDGENNSGTHPKLALMKASRMGWNPLVIFWGIKDLPYSITKELDKVQNVLLVSGFNESVLSQVLRNIKTGSIDSETELWAIYDDPRYSVIK